MVYIGIRDLFSYSDSQAAYAFINAWWAGAYIGYVCKMKIKVAIYAFILSMILLCILYFSSFYYVLYHDAPEKLSVHLLFTICVQSLLVTSPIIFSFIISRGERYYRKNLNEKEKWAQSRFGMCILTSTTCTLFRFRCALPASRVCILSQRLQVWGPVKVTGSPNGGTLAYQSRATTW